MKVVILAGGLGTRLSEETLLKPKPMVEIGPKPILWHIMKIFYSYGFNDFIICGGYKVNIIKEFFNNYLLYTHDVTFDYINSKVSYTNPIAENWKVSIVDTGLDTNTAGRIKRISSLLNDNEPFFFTYGDGLADINLNELLKLHKKNDGLATLTAVEPPGRFGIVNLNTENQVETFSEKPTGDRRGRINGGFFVLEKEIIKYIEKDNQSFEYDVLPQIVKQKKLFAYNHNGFWRPMDTVRDLENLKSLWNQNNAPWKIWD